MTGAQAQQLLAWYFGYVESRPELHLKSCRYLLDFCKRAQMIPTAKSDKLMRWLGFAQGVLFCDGVFTIDQLKEHSELITREEYPKG